MSSPLKALIESIAASGLSASRELLGLVRARMSGWVEAETTADTGIGRTVETLLGIPMNSSTAPDYKGIEIKSHRELSSVRSALFTQTPDWSLSRLKSGRAIADKYGYIPAAPPGWTRKTLQVTLAAGRPNQQGLGLVVERQLGLLEADELMAVAGSGGRCRKVADVAVWTLAKLHERLLTKHRETFWLDVESRKDGTREYFRCKRIEHTRSPLPAQFDLLLEQGAIVVDLMLARPSGNGDTYSFKIRRKDRPLLFPESSVYQF